MVLDNARLHHAKALNDLYAPGQALERITPIYMPPLRPRPWVPQNTCGTPPRTISPTPARSPRRTPSRPSPPTSPTAPSTTTSSTSQSHRHAPILFNSSHSAFGATIGVAGIVLLAGLGSASDAYRWTPMSLLSPGSVLAGKGLSQPVACAATTVFALTILLALVAARPMRVVRLLFGAEPNHIAQHVLSGRRV